MTARTLTILSPSSLSWATVIVICLMLTGHAAILHAKERPVTQSPSRGNTIENKPDFEEPTPLIRFAGALMTDTRARSFAESSNYTYLRWRPCAGNAQHCAIITVQGKRGRIFEYHLIDKTCASVMTDGATQSPHTNSVSIPSGPGSRIATSNETSEISCLGGFYAFMRVKQKNSFLGDNFGYYLQFNETFQVMNNGQWNNLISYLVDSWQLLVQGSGMTDVGHSYQVLNDSGEIIATDNTSNRVIAASGSGTGDLDARCRDLAQTRKNKQALGIELVNDACTVASWPVPDTFTFGVSLVFEYSQSYEFPLCEPLKNTLSAGATVVEDNTYADCKANPGRYFPQDYPPVQQPMILHEDDGFLPEIPEKITIEGDCPSHTSQITSFSIANLNCTITTPYTCEEGENGGCQCKRDERIGSNVETVCTDI